MKRAVHGGSAVAWVLFFEEQNNFPLNTKPRPPQSHSQSSDVLPLYPAVGRSLRAHLPAIFGLPDRIQPHLLCIYCAQAILGRRVNPGTEGHQGESLEEHEGYGLSTDLSQVTRVVFSLSTKRGLERALPCFKTREWCLPLILQYLPASLLPP